MSFNMVTAIRAFAHEIVGAMYVSHTWQKSRAHRRALTTDAIHSKAQQHRLTLDGDAQ
jgi:hypothetical protein